MTIRAAREKCFVHKSVAEDKIKEFTESKDIKIKPYLEKGYDFSQDHLTMNWKGC